MAKRVSEIEDGFALKRRRDKGKSGKKPKVKRKHTIPPPPVKHILSSYTMSNPISKRTVPGSGTLRAQDVSVFASFPVMPLTMIVAKRS